MIQKKILSFILYFIISTFIITSYACDCETMIKYVTVSVFVEGPPYCNSNCTYNNVIHHYNRYNSHWTEAISVPFACQGGNYTYSTYPAEGTIRYHCISYCCTTGGLQCIVSSDVVPKPRVPCDKSGVSVDVPCEVVNFNC
jgi:hypothetical protein